LRIRDDPKPRVARPWWRRALNLGGGLALFVIGLFFAIAPGPAFIFFGLAALLIANEFYFAARLLDRIDVWIAPGLQWLRRHWRKLSPLARHVTTGCLIGGSVMVVVVGILLGR
jgi:hypothetical protein